MRASVFTDAYRQPEGLYDPQYEHDACGVAFVVDMHGRKSHKLLRQGLQALCNLDHRGATGAEENVGDGAGILIQIPDQFFREVCTFTLPDAGQYATGIAFLPIGDDARQHAIGTIEQIVDEEGLQLLGWRDVATDNSAIGSMARDVEPCFKQLFIAGQTPHELTGLALERKDFVLRKRIELERGTAEIPACYFASLSSRTLVF